MRWKLALTVAIVAVMGVFLYQEYKPGVSESQIEISGESTKQTEDSVGNQEGQVQFGIHEGQQAPDIQLTTLEGKPFKLSDYRGEKVILNFWATWCPPCKAEMPDMQEFHEKHRNEGVEVVAVNLTVAEKKIEDVHQFIKDYGITFTIPLDETGMIGEQFQANSIPTSYLIDEKGIVRQHMVGPMSYDWMVEKINNMN